MQINATLIGQAIGFLVLIWITWKFVWPPLLGAIEGRQKTIADGLAAANRGQNALEDAKTQALEIIREARNQAAQIVEQANRRGGELVEEARGTALSEGERMLDAARSTITTETARARGDLRNQVGALALAGAAQVLKREVDAKAHAQLLEDLSARIAAG